MATLRKARPVGLTEHHVVAVEVSIFSSRMSLAQAWRTRGNISRSGMLPWVGTAYSARRGSRSTCGLRFWCNTDTLRSRKRVCTGE